MTNGRGGKRSCKYYNICGIADNCLRCENYQLFVNKTITHQEKARQYARERVSKVFVYQTGLSEDNKKMIADILRERGRL